MEPPPPRVPAAPVPAFGMLADPLLVHVFSYAGAPETAAAGATCCAVRGAAIHSMPAIALRDGRAAQAFLARVESHQAAAAAAAPYQRLRSLTLAGGMDYDGDDGSYLLLSHLLTHVTTIAPRQGSEMAIHQPALLAALDMEGLRVPTPEAFAAVLDLLQRMGPCTAATVDGPWRRRGLAQFGLPGPGVSVGEEMPMNPESLGKVLRATMTSHLQELGCGRLGAAAAPLVTAYLLGSIPVWEAGFLLPDLATGESGPHQLRSLVYIYRRRCLQGGTPLPPAERGWLNDPARPMPADPWRHCALQRLDLCGATILQQGMAHLVAALTLGTAPNLKALILCTTRAYRRWRRFPHGEYDPDFELDALHAGRMTPGAVRVLIRNFALQHEFKHDEATDPLSRPDGAWLWRLEELDLSGQRAFGDRGLQALSRAIYISHQRAAHDFGGGAFFSPARYVQMRALGLAGPYCKLRILRLADTGITPASAMLPAAPPYPHFIHDTLAVLVNPRFSPLEEMDLRGNPLCTTHALRLLSGEATDVMSWPLRMQHTDPHVREPGDLWPPASCSTLRRLWVDRTEATDIGNNPIWRCPERWHRVHVALPDSLVTLCLRRQGLGDPGASALAALVHRGRVPALEEVDLADNGIGDCGAFLLLCAFRGRGGRSARRLRRLSLADNSIRGWACSLMPPSSHADLGDTVQRALSLSLPGPLARYERHQLHHYTAMINRIVSHLSLIAPTAPSELGRGIPSLVLQGNPLCALSEATSSARVPQPLSPWRLAVGPALRVLDLRGAHGAKSLPFPSSTHTPASTSSQERDHERRRRRSRRQTAWRMGWGGLPGRPSLFDADGDAEAMAQFSRPAYYAYRGQSASCLDGHILGEALREAPNLEVLRLGESRLDDAAFCALLDALRPSPTTSTTTLLPALWWLDICDSDVGDPALRHLLALATAGLGSSGCCPRLRRLGLAGTRGVTADATVPALAEALAAGVWPCLQELSLSLLAPEGLGALVGKGRGGKGGEGEAEECPVAVRLVEQRDTARERLTAARRHFDVLRLERGWGKEEDEQQPAPAGADDAKLSFLGRALSTLWPGAAGASAAAASSAGVDAGMKPAASAEQEEDQQPPPLPPPEPSASSIELGPLGLGLLGSERGEDEWEYPDAVEEQLDRLEREGGLVGDDPSRKGPRLAFDPDDFDEEDPGPGFWETWDAFGWEAGEMGDVEEWDFEETMLTQGAEDSESSDGY